ncbi:hypothetical protein GCM10023168_37500 [Fodinibacter luteus]|uniref:Uncharacterized protein n=1 Tax=Fodinibacter luteus TaxID=552064 RepID=A0ABP8KS00_9MICO
MVAGVSVQRVAAVVVLLVLGVLSLPFVALFLDGEATQNWVIPVQLGLMALVGALVGRLVPALAGPGASPARAAGVGALAGLAAALVGLLLFFVLLTGTSGA